jgi:hypothetical protein
MKINEYVLEWNPFQYTIPSPSKYNSAVITHASIGYFSWGSTVVGKRIELLWYDMSAKQYERFRNFYSSVSTPLIWYPQHANAIFYTDTNSPVNGTVTGAISGAHAVISSFGISGIGANTWDVMNTAFITSVSSGAAFILPEVITSSSGIATLTSVDVIPNFSIEIMDLQGSYVEFLGHNEPFRKNVKMDILIKGINSWP